EPAVAPEAFATATYGGPIVGEARVDDLVVEAPADGAAHASKLAQRYALSGLQLRPSMGGRHAVDGRPEVAAGMEGAGHVPKGVARLHDVGARWRRSPGGGEGAAPERRACRPGEDERDEGEKREREHATAVDGRARCVAARDGRGGKSK